MIRVLLKKKYKIFRGIMNLSYLRVFFYSLFCLEISPSQFQLQTSMFDNYNIQFKLTLEMVKKQSGSACKSSADASWDEKEAIYEELQEHSTIPTIESLKKEEGAGGGSRSKGVQKGRKKRVYNPEGRFLKEHRKRFFLFPFHYSTLFPFSTISWESWKPSGYFIKMAGFMGGRQELPRKTADQCKSFDQRQKKEVYKDVDLLEAALLEHQATLLASDEIAILAGYLRKMETTSDYMAFLTHSPSEDCEEVKLESRSSQSSLPHALPPLSGKHSNSFDYNEFLDEEK